MNEDGDLYGSRKMMEWIIGLVQYFTGTFLIFYQDPEIRLRGIIGHNFGLKF